MNPGRLSPEARFSTTPLEGPPEQHGRGEPWVSVPRKSGLRLSCPWCDRDSLKPRQRAKTPREKEERPQKRSLIHRVSRGLNEVTHSLSKYVSVADISSTEPLGA